MTWPVTPNPSIHDDTKGVKQTSPFSEAQLLTWIERLPLAMVKDLVNAILSALGLGGAIPTADNIITDVYNALLDIPQGNISGLVGSLEDLGSQIESLLVSILKSFGIPIPSGSGVPDLLGLVTSTLQNIGTEAESILLQIPLISTILKLLGLVQTTPGGGTTPPPTTGQTVPPLTTLLNLLDTGSQIPPSLLTALAPGSSTNVLNDSTFDTFSDLQGQSQWCWDGWLGTGAFSGVNSSVRTRRPGRIIIYYIVGTTQGVYMFGGEPVNKGGDGQILEYLRDPAYHFLVDWCLTGTDPTYFEWVIVPYPAAEYPQGIGINAGLQWLRNDVMSNNDPFILVMDSQGNQVGAALYDQLRFGDMQPYRSRLLAAVGLGNLRREEGHTFPGYPDPAPGTSGMDCSIVTGPIGPYTDAGNASNPKGGNLIDTEDLWWDFCVKGDYFACTPLTGSTVKPPADALGGNVGDIGGTPALSLRNFYIFLNESYVGSPNIITDIITWGSKKGLGGLLNILEDYLGDVLKQIDQLGPITSPHNSYFFAKPFADQGDDRTFVEIGLDYINSFANTAFVNPPVEGQRAQLLAEPHAAQPYQVITAGASVMWVNVSVPADETAIIVAVNAYDSDGNLIATVVADECTVVGPQPSSNWSWVPLQADFVMPAGTATARLLLDVEPDAMTTGIVWFDACIFEPSTIIDAGWLDITNMPQLSTAHMSGPQGEADLLTAWQNLIDSLASANSQTSVTGVQLAQMLQQAGQTALNSTNALNLGVSHERILGNPATQHLWDGLTPSGQVTFPLPTGTLPTVVISEGTSLIGFLNTSKVAMIGFVEFMAEGSSPTGIYLNVYSIDTATGDQTSVWSSGDISANITASLDWVAVTIPSDERFAVDVGQIMAWEIVASGSAITVVAETLSVMNKSYLIPPNVGASRTIASTGGVSPATLTPSQLGYGGTAPFVCMSVSALPPTYYPSRQSPFEHPGIYTYPIPTYLESGDFIDLVACSAGGAGGWTSGHAATTFLGLTLVPSTQKSGGGGQPGQWATKTLTYGTDIATDVTDLVVIIGNGGCAPSGAGGDTIIGYGTLTTPAFDALGGGDNTHSTSLSWQHTAAAGAWVLVCINSLYGTFDITYGDTDIVPIPAGLRYCGNRATDGGVGAFVFPNVPAGTATITVTFAQTTYAAGHSISFTDVSSIGAVTNTAGVGTVMSQSVACGTNQIAVQLFGALGHGGPIGNFTGGTHESYDHYTLYDSYTRQTYATAGIAVSYGSGSLNFGAATTNTDYWAGLSVLLNPTVQHVIMQIPGGQPGGAGGIANPNNPNTTSNGPGLPGQSWAGVVYAGSNTTTALNFPGNFPGGAGSGGSTSGGYAGPWPMNTAGAPGVLYATARQGDSAGTAIGGIGGGGTELSVVFEAVGTGGENTNNNALSWTHDSAGGPSCGVVLIGAIQYTAGAPSITCTYGNSQFTYTLAEFNYQTGTTPFGMFAFGIVGAPSGTQTVTIGASGATIGQLSGNTLSYQNVGSFGDFYTNTGKGTAFSLSGIASTTGQLVVGGFADVANVITGFNQTPRWAQNVTASIPMVIGDAAGGSTVNFTAATSATNYWAALAGVLQPVS